MDPVWTDYSSFSTSGVYFYQETVLITPDCVYYILVSKCPLQLTSCTMPMNSEKAQFSWLRMESISLVAMVMSLRRCSATNCWYTTEGQGSKHGKEVQLLGHKHMRQERRLMPKYPWLPRSRVCTQALMNKTNSPLKKWSDSKMDFAFSLVDKPDIYIWLWHQSKGPSVCYKNRF